MCPNFRDRSVRRATATSVSNVKRWTFKVQFKLSERTFVFLGVLLLTIRCSALPIVAPHRGNISLSHVSQAVDFLTKYGYLPPSDPGTGNLRTEDQLQEAILTMQRFGNITVTGLVDEATVQLMQRRRCGMPDIIPGTHYRVKRYTIQGQKWQSTNLTWSVKSSSASTADLQMVRSQLRKAFAVWSSASALTFIEEEGPSADIVVSFLRGPHGDGYPFDGEGSILAHAFFPGEGIGGDAHFDAAEKWLPSHPEDENEGVNLFAVAAHEIGHSLGLSHSSTPGSLMFPYYQMLGEYFSLPKDDADGIKHLYGLKNSRRQPTMPTMATTTEISNTSQETPLQTTTAKPRKIPHLPEFKDPDVCNTSIDAISIIRREIFVFKGKHFWRLDTNRTLRSGYPVRINRFWHDFPSDIQRIDALYERPSDTKIVFFSGKQFWIFQANQLEPGYPKLLVELGLPADLEKIDAALVWGHNGRTYLFSGKEYWKFDEHEGRVELDYPRKTSTWRGVPPNIDAAFQWKDGITYFFKGQKFWKFNDVKMKVDTKGAIDIGEFWFKCTKNLTEKTTTATTTQESIEETDSANKSSPSLQLHYLYAIIVFIYWWIQKVYELQNYI